MKQSDGAALSRRERQIMDIIYRRGKATAAEVQKDLPDPPSYSAVRAALRLLEQKGHIRHQQDGQQYVFLPTVTPDRARNSALSHVVRTFFAGNAAEVVNALVEQERLSEADLDRLAGLIERARKESDR